MEFSEVLKNRYSCKKFDGRKINEEQLNYILEAGRLAPTAKNSQEQRIYVIDSEESLAKIDAATPCRYNAGTVLAVAFDKNGVYNYPRSTRDSGVGDATLAGSEEILMIMDLGFAAEDAGPLPNHNGRKELSETVKYL